MAVTSQESEPTKSTGSAYVLFFASLILVFTIGLAAQVISLTVGLLLTEILLILLPAVVYVRWKRLRIAEGLRWRPAKPGILMRCAVLGVLANGIAAALAVVVSWLLEPLIGRPPEVETLMPTTLAGLGFGLLIGALVAGVCEETLFRGAIQATLERRGASRAVFITALLFASFHMNPWIFLPAAGLGVLFGIVTVRTNSTLPAIVCHASNNAAGLTFGFLAAGRLDEHQAMSMLWWVGGVSTILFAVALVEFLRHTAGGERHRSPLTQVPAGLSRRFKRIAGVSLAVFVVLLFVGLRTFLSLHPMTTDRLAPDVNRGDRVLVIKTRYINVDIQPGDIVAFRRDGRLFLRKVARTDAESVWILETSADKGISPTPISRNEITGKMIYRISRTRQ